MTCLNQNCPGCISCIGSIGQANISQQTQSQALAESVQNQLYQAYQNNLNSIAQSLGQTYMNQAGSQNYFGSGHNHTSPTIEETYDEVYKNDELGDIINHFLEKQKQDIDAVEEEYKLNMAVTISENEDRAKTFWTWLEKKHPGVTKERMLAMKAFL